MYDNSKDIYIVLRPLAIKGYWEGFASVVKFEL